jgi:hypothetical protein
LEEPPAHFALVASLSEPLPRFALPSPSALSGHFAPGVSWERLPANLALAALPSGYLPGTLHSGKVLPRYGVLRLVTVVSA